MPAPSSCAATTTNDFSKLSRPGNHETGKVFSGGTTTYMNEVGQESCNAGGCALDQGFAMQGPNWQTFNAGMAAVNVSANGRVVLSGINGAPTFLYMYYMDGWILEGSSESGKIAYGELDEQEIPMSQWSLPTTMLLNSATPHQLTEFDASGQLTFSQATGALASMTGTVDHAGVGTAFYGDTFGRGRCRLRMHMVFRRRPMAAVMSLANALPNMPTLRLLVCRTHSSPTELYQLHSRCSITRTTAAAAPKRAQGCGNGQAAAVQTIGLQLPQVPARLARTMGRRTSA